ncbi:MAG: hypothetical protein JNJ59_06205 [Deltaproteobacteria bacterium]|nr:hypothetical protein [Deltaproteobacteria bacterium]
MRTSTCRSHPFVRSAARALAVGMLGIAGYGPASAAEPTPVPPSEPVQSPGPTPSPEPVPSPQPTPPAKAPVVTPLAPTSPAKSPTPTAPAEKPPERTSGGVPVEGVLRFEHHGLFRFRPELLLGGDLGLGASSVPSPLGVTTGVDADADSLAWASIRLRYEPTLFIGPSLEIHLALDALDNLVLGSTHQNAGGDVAFGLTGDAQAPPSSGRYGWKDALTVREAWVRWLAFEALDVRAGRMAEHYGLGLARNDGRCEDCDYGTLVDRAMVGLALSGFKLEAAWEFTAVGATSDLASASSRAADGQPTDLGQADDVTTYLVRVGQYPTTAAEQAARVKLLDEDRGWAVEWSLSATFTDQTLSSSEQTGSSSVECTPSGTLADGTPIQDYDCIRLFRRNAFLLRPGAWFRAEHRPAWGESIRFELEAAGLFGDIAHPQRLEDEDEKEAKAFSGFAFAAQVEWQRQTLKLGFDFGLATGDNGRHLGVNDGQDIVDPDDDGYATNSDLRNNHTITSYVMNRDFHIDQILFRQVVGAVTNAFYIKPWIASEVLKTDAATLTVRFDLLYAAAMRPSGTPGGGDHWGLELDSQATLDLTSGFRASLILGVLMPFDALADPDTGAKGDPAVSIRALLGWRF